MFEYPVRDSVPPVVGEDVVLLGSDVVQTREPKPAGQLEKILYLIHPPISLVSPHDLRDPGSLRVRFGGNSRLSGRDDETGVLGGRNYRGGSLEVRQSVTAGEQRNPAYIH